MRYVFLAILALLLVVLLVFTVQNFAPVDLAFLAWRIRLPVAILVLGTFLLGGVMGGACLTLFKTIVEKVNRSRAPDRRVRNPHPASKEPPR
jgi:uncharacterized integral membrane protein